jgi:hypothetical protein
MKISPFLFGNVENYTYLCGMKTKRQDIVVMIINKELDKYGLTMADVLDSKDWFTKYTMTNDEWVKWKEYSINLMRDKLRMSKKIAEKEFIWLDLMWGLRHEEEKGV